MCVLESELFSGAIEMAFIIAPVHFNFGNANALVCKGFLYNFTFLILLLANEELQIFSPWFLLLCFHYFSLFLFSIFVAQHFLLRMRV